MNKPRLMMVATELASYGDASRPVADALLQLLAASMETKPPAPLPAPQGRTNNQRFNNLLNNCERPRAIYNALLALSVQGEEDCVIDQQFAARVNALPADIERGPKE